MKASQLFLWGFFALAIILGAIWQFYPLENAAKRMIWLPLEGKEFTGVDVNITPMERDFFKDVRLIKRVYTINDHNYFMYVLDGTKNRHAVHDPSYCFRGGGWSIKTDQAIPIPGGEGRLYQIVKDGQEREAIIWFSNGNQRYGSPIRYWIQATLRRLTLGNWCDEPVLVSVQPLDNTDVDWNAFFAAFPQILKL